MDGSKKRVTFDEEDNNAQNEALPPVDTEQPNGNGDTEHNDGDGADEEEGEGEQQQTVNSQNLIYKIIISCFFSFRMLRI